MIRALLPLLLAGSLQAATTVKVQVRDRGVIEMPLERYVAAVLAGETGDFQSREALKAMSVAVRTYAVRLRGRHADQGFDFCDTTHCQHVDPRNIPARFEAVAEETAGELLWFEGKPAFTPYTGDCGGRSEAAGAIWPELAAPYLRSHIDEYCVRGRATAWQWSAEPREILEALGRSGLRGPRVLERASIGTRTESARARTLVLSGGGEAVRISAGSFRLAMGRELGWQNLRSDRYEVRASGGRIVFEGRGMGHGAGLCQRGAEQMGLGGRGYREILAYYYPGTAPGVGARGISWQRLGGDTLSLMATQPAQDGAVLEVAQRLAGGLSQRTRWNLPAGVEIRIYPDLDSFRNATGEPGWVAAHTEGRRIHLQPAAVLRQRGALESTLRHELIHVLLESQAGPELPLWFREGFAGYLEAPVRGGSGHAPADSELRQTSDAARARLAYREANAMVTGLAGRYGEATVLGWIQRGLPPEVTKASASQATTKSR